MIPNERFDRALGYYLAIGSHFTSDSLSLLEELAVGSVNSFRQSSGNAFTAVSEKQLQNEAKTEKYEHVLSLIEIHQLYHLLLKKNYHFENRDGKDDLDTPIISLIMLVGLTRAGKFLMESCSPPEDTSVDAKEGTLQTKKGTAYSRANLPLDLVAEQLKSRPKLLYWFLFQVFIHKPDIYVKFPTTAVPPLAITDLHRIQFSLFVDYANERGNKINADSPAFMAVDEETPFMAFLKAALPHGGAQPNNVRQMLEARRGGRIDSPVFARELAFVIEKFGRGTADDAKTILDLYLRGTNNLYLAVSFAERNISHSSALWEMLVEYCTATNSPSDAEEKGHGALFGSLLEAAAHCGADLASLVSKIPTGMAIEGLRPKLVAAVTDYRHKVKIHEHVAKIQTDDKIAVLRELSHLTRRGARISRMPSSQGENIHKSSALFSSKSASHSLLEIERARLKTVSRHSSDTFSLSIR